MRWAALRVTPGLHRQLLDRLQVPQVRTNIPSLPLKSPRDSELAAGRTRT